MKKIKVAHIITLLELGGAQQNTLFTVKNLNRDRFEVLLISGSGGILDDETKKCIDLKTYFLKNMVRPVRPWKDFLCLLQLIGILKKEKPQIVHTHSSKAGILGRIAARAASAPILIHSIHGFGFNPYQKFLTRWLFILLERWIALITRTLIAVSAENIKEGLQLGIGTEDQYVLIRSGVDIQKIKKAAQSSDAGKIKKELGLPADTKIITMIAPFKIQKNPTDFVLLAQKAAVHFSNLKFLMAGDGELREKIERLIESLNVGSLVKLLGWRRDIPEIINLSDIIVFTSLWEGLPRAAVESLILGKPILAFAVDGLKEIVRDGENGFLFPPRSLDPMADRLIQLLKNENDYRKLSGSAAKTIDDSFDIYKMVLKQEELYENLVKNYVPL